MHVIFDFLINHRSLKSAFFFYTVIEVACGEYGDNIKTLVNAIKNGKHDIRAGQPFPDLKGEPLNNSVMSSENERSGWKYGLSKNPEEMKEIVSKDKNDASTIEDKFPENKANEVANLNIIPSSTTNDIVKQGQC